MEGVTVVDHPLIQHKLTLIRDKNLSTKSFRELLSEIGMLLCYEVTRDLPLEKVEIETPMTRMLSPKIAGKKLVFAPILRAGVTFIDGMLELVPSARVPTSDFIASRRPSPLSNISSKLRRTSLSGSSLSWYRCWRPQTLRLRPSIVSRSVAPRIFVLFAWLARRRASIICAGFIPTFQSGRRQSTIVSMKTALSFPGSAT